MKNVVYYLLFVAATVLMLQCSRQKEKIEINSADVLHSNQFILTEVIIYDIFSPPVASRIYAYTSLASYEAIRFQEPGSNSIAEKLNGFSKMPAPEAGKKYDYTLAATEAFFTVAYKVVFSIDSLKAYEKSVYNKFKNNMDNSTYQNSISFGKSIGTAILERAANDRYLQTRAMPKYLGSKDDGKWDTTPPDYFDGTEPYWQLVKSFSLDTCSQFRPMPPLTFSKDSNSVFYRMVKDVYLVSNANTDTLKNIAKYWDDNPFVVEHTGHLMFANKKITPGGHWMGITAIACKKSNASAVKSAKAYTLTAVALFDGFIGCWDAKYKYEYIRPITLIKAWIQRNWEPFLQTPPFPEYTSGHSTISGAASTVLTKMFGDGFAFHDNSDSAYIDMTRDFSSFSNAADEASISRFYGGIHFKPSLDSGLAKGKLIGNNLWTKIK